MSARRGLELVGFEGDALGAGAVREIVAAVDDLLDAYSVPLQGIVIRGLGAGGAGQSAAARSASSARWLVLDGAALATLAASSGGGPSRSWWGGRRVAPRPVYVAVVREFAEVLDRAGGYRARQVAQRRLIAESLRGRAHPDYSPLDPGGALAAAFVEVTLRGKRAGAQATMLHEILVTIATADPATQTT